ncbi:serine/threonine-protein kinase [Actinoplanes regularis]|uniref:serine/threonine-protein kinase n=1 Tax=Actinoplanes regularis TaxID=52697 RepID=UPI0024A22F95|nr:serine/threonine-protein kinase [Actinoplanes regularis]GLW33696.1 serine/threonine protein kinase [Actinoplanes regularis]
MSVPELIGRYRVGRRLGSGAFATVWFADDEELRSPVAVKVLADNWTHQLDVRARFTEEARIMRRAESDRLVRVLDVGELPDGRPYLVMTYASGGTLAERLEDGPLPVREALRVAVEAAHGVAVLHGLGIVHRDLKPSNVFFHENRVLVGDLGLAKALAHGSGFTVVAGSPGYMAPEQALLGGGLDERTDVYALGALTYHMLTGRTPTLPASIQAVPAAAAQPVVRPSRLRPGVPAAVDTVVMRALASAPARRWPSAAAFSDALEAALTAPAPRRRLAVVRRLAVTAALSAVLLGAGSAFDAVPTWTRVTDASGEVSVWVPAAWAKQVRGTGWNPRTLRLADGRAPGLVVGTDLTAWDDPASPVPGVFAGVSPALRGATPALPDHSTCTRQPDPRPNLGTRTAVVRRWTGCGGTSVSFTEALITPPTGDYGLYVQIRQVDGTDHTEAILRDVRTG